MPSISVSVAGRSYTLSCGAGEEEKVLSLASELDKEAKIISDKVSFVSEAKLILMAALQIADRAREAQEANAATAAMELTPPTIPEDEGYLEEEIVASVLDEVTMELEVIAESISID